MFKKIFNLINLQYFAEVGPVQVTTQTGSGKDMSPTMKTYFDTALLVNAREQHIFEQFTKKTPIKGNKAEWRKFNTFGNADQLTEGVIPTGKDFGMTKLEATVNQFGMYTTISDRLEAESYDDVMLGASEEMGASMGNTQDELTRDIFATGTAVMYGEKGGTAAASRAAITADHKLTCSLILKAKTWLVKHKAPKIDGLYTVIVHPSVAEDLIRDEEWKEFHKYNDTDAWKKGYVGEIYGCRVIEATNAQIVKEGASNAGVYLCYAMGADAVGTIQPNGEDFRMIVKDKGEIGGPLEQFSTIGYKGCHGGRVLYQDRLVRLEVGSSYSAVDEAN